MPISSYEASQGCLFTVADTADGDPDLLVLMLLCMICTLHLLCPDWIQFAVVPSSLNKLIMNS